MSDSAKLRRHTGAPRTDGRRLILIADDNAMNQKVLGQQLRLLGEATDSAGNGLEALQRWQDGDYAMLITDLHMPLLDGYQLAAAIRATECGKPRRPIIAFTADDLQGKGRHSLANGMDDYLSKPVQLARLKTMLARWLPAGGSTPEHQAGGTDHGQAAPLPIFDSNVLKGLIGTDEAVVCDFLEEFRCGSRPIGAALLAAGQAGQPALAGALAHQIKSSARSVGAPGLARLCTDLETAGKGGDGRALQALLPLFARELASVEASLQAYLDEQAARQDHPDDR